MSRHDDAGATRRQAAASENLKITSFKRGQKVNDTKYAHESHCTEWMSVRVKNINKRTQKTDLA